MIDTMDKHSCELFLEDALEIGRRLVETGAEVKRVEDTGKLPMGELAAGSGTDKKTMERHRKYLVAILLAFTNGYEIIRGHLCQVGPKRGGDEA